MLLSITRKHSEYDRNTDGHEQSSLLKNVQLPVVFGFMLCCESCSS